MFLSSLRRRPGHEHDAAAFPWSLPLLRTLDEIVFTAPVTFLVGENGAGKSTLLEGMAAGMRAVAAGGHDLARDPTLAAARALADGFVFQRRRHARTRLFLRAEDVFGFTSRMTATMQGLDAEAAAIRRDMPEGFGQRLALGVVQGERRAIARDYGENPDGRSHGETFLALLQRRLVPNGLYFLDEPETPLSPSRVLALIALLAQSVGQGSQFIVATHSPMLMALPGAAILEVGPAGVRSAAWGDLEHVRVTRAFLNNPDRLLRQVLEAEDS